MTPNRQTARVAAVASINDPLRRALFEFISHSDSPVGRDEAARAVGITRSTAAFHLDRLVDDGVLVVEFKRLGGKTGPGSGRPSKLYRPASDELLVSVPERHYELAGSLLASSIEESTRTGEPVLGALARVAAESGRRLGSSAGSIQDALIEGGYEPEPEPDGSTRLANCPFHRLATEHTDLVCQANLNLLQGVLEGAQDTEHEVVFDPCDGQCCVRIARVDSSPDPS